jgi:hypothetical protein
MRKSVLLVASVALALLLASGVALAANISCPTGGNGLCMGTPEADTMTGTNAFDRMYGRDGADTMRGGGFEDSIRGEGGNDTIYGQGGRNRLYGDSFRHETIVGNDYIIGGPAADTIYAGPGSDRVRGNPGGDTIYGEDGNDRVWGGDGGDHFHANQTQPPALEDGYDIVHGGDGLDRLNGGFGELYGEGGGDYLGVFGAKATIRGGVGDDHLSLGTFTTSDRRAYTQVAYGGPGEDDFGITSLIASEPPPDEFIFQAADGESDVIRCNNVRNNTVVADPQDRFPAYELTSPDVKYGRQYCDSLTIVR